MLRAIRFAAPVALALFAHAVAAQPRPEVEVRFTTFGVGAGLSQNSVYALARDPRGFLWIGTHDGLNRFDGHDFVVFRHVPDDARSPSHHRIGALLPDDIGGLWLLTGAGTDHLDARTGQFTRYGVPENGGSPNALAPRRAGGIWVGTSAGLYVLDPRAGRLFAAAAGPWVVRAVAEGGARSGPERATGCAASTPIRSPCPPPFRPNSMACRC